MLWSLMQVKFLQEIQKKVVRLRVQLRVQTINDHFLYKINLIMTNHMPWSITMVAISRLRVCEVSGAFIWTLSAVTKHINPYVALCHRESRSTVAIEKPWDCWQKKAVLPLLVYWLSWCMTAGPGMDWCFHSNWTLSHWDTHCHSRFYLQSPRGVDLLLGFCKTCHNTEQGCSGQRADLSFLTSFSSHVSPCSCPWY